MYLLSFRRSSIRDSLLFKTNSEIQSKIRNDSSIHVRKVPRRSSVKIIIRNRSVDVQRINRLSYESERARKSFDDAQIKPPSSLVHVRRIKRSQDSEDNTLDETHSNNMLVKKNCVSPSIRVKREFFCLTSCSCSFEFMKP